MSARNWVLARANCTLDDNLSTLMAQVKKDIQGFNRLRSDKRGIRQFRVSFDNGEFVIERMVEVTNHRGTHIVEDAEYSHDVIIVRCMESSISVGRKDHLNFEIEPRWNAQSQTCDLLVDGEPYPLWRISEMILGEFLFGGDTRTYRGNNRHGHDDQGGSD